MARARKQDSNVDQPDGESNGGTTPGLPKHGDFQSIAGSLKLRDPIAQQLFDEVVANHTKFAEAQRSMVLYAADAGQALTTLKSRLGHGQFGDALRRFSEEFGLSMRTAQRYMLVARRKQELLDQLREEQKLLENTCTDEELLEGTSLNNAIRLLAGPSEDRPTTSSNPAPRPASYSNCRFPPDVAKVINEFWGICELVISEATESETFGSKQIDVATGALSQSHAYSQRVVINAFRPVLPTAALAQLSDAWEQQVVTEALVLLPTTNAAAAVTSLRERPRLVFRELLTAYISNSNGIFQQPFPAPAMLVAFCSNERFEVLAKAFASIADAYVPLHPAP